MDLFYALLIYCIFLLILLVVFVIIGLNFWKALVLSLIICQFILLILRSPFGFDNYEESGSCYALYILICVFTPIIVYLYVIISIATEGTLNESTCRKGT